MRVALLVVAAQLAGIASAAHAGYSGVPSPGVPLQPLMNRDGYDYAVSVIQEGSVQNFWWCGYNKNGVLNKNYPPGQPAPAYTDVILNRSVDLSTGQWSSSPNDSPVVLGEGGPGAWDSAFACNPRVVRGSFTPYGALGAHYTSAMYYVATDRSGDPPDPSRPGGSYNRIGVAFSNDNRNWVKYTANPVVDSGPTVLYGTQTVAAYNRNGSSDILLFYEDNTHCDPNNCQYTWYYREATDGVHFGSPTKLSTAGILSPSQIEGLSDIAIDSNSQTLYSLVQYKRNAPRADKSGYGFALYKAPAPLALLGQGTWQALGFVDSNLTGYYVNHTPGFLHDRYDNISPWLPSIEMYFSVGGANNTGGSTPGDCSIPASGNCPATWDIAFEIWKPTPRTVPLIRYFNSSIPDHWVTNGYVGSGYQPGGPPNGIMGYMYMSAAADPSLTPPPGHYIYSCAAGRDHFISLGADCDAGNGLQLGTLGWLYNNGGSGRMPIYRCWTGTDHFVAWGADCEGQPYPGELMGYAQPTAS